MAMETSPPLPPEPPLPPPEPPPSGSPLQPIRAEISEADRSWCIGLHLSGLALFVIPCYGNLIAPLIIWLIKRSESPLIDATGKEVLNFQISYSIYLTIAAILCWMCVGFIILPVLVVAWLVLTIVAAVKTSNGEQYRYPYILRFLT